MALRATLKSWRQWFKTQHYGRNATDSRYAILEACLIGFCSALAALVIKHGINWLGSGRIYLSEHYGAWAILPLVGLLFGGLAGWLIEQTCPPAAGGGIPQVKAALARYPIPLSWQVALVKSLGTIFVLGAGIPLGRRAPTVHIGAALAAELSRWLPTSPEHRRQMIAAGAAAGLAAGFTTPIAGVLFVVEELMRDVSGLTLETSIVASFVGAVTSLLLQTTAVTPALTLAPPLTVGFSAPALPFYLLLGALAGILGAWLNRGILALQKWQRQRQLSLIWRIGSIGLISGLAMAAMPPFFRDNAGLRDFVITGELGWQNILLALAVHFLLAMLAYSADTPGGLFAPALVMGAALGYLVGDLGRFWLGPGLESTFALAGMGAFFTSVVRVPVTAIIIVFELTRNFNAVLPLMICCAVSYLVAESLFPRSLYEHLLEAKGIYLAEDQPQRDFLLTMTAAQVMQTQVESLASHLTLAEVLPIMSQSHHRGFPVVERGRLVGVFTQTDLANASQHSNQTSLAELMTPNPITVTPDTPLSDVLYLLNRYQLSRLPVVEGYKLVGIITRTDIIREEVSQLGGQGPVQSHPAYIAYQTRAPHLGEGRILLPLNNPQTATALFQIAGAIAQTHNYEIDCLQVVKTPKTVHPSEYRASTQAARKLLQRMERLGRHQQQLVHTHIRLAHSVTEAILDTVREQKIDLLIMGWQGTEQSESNILGSVMTSIIEKAPCDLLLVKLGPGPQTYPHSLLHRASWLIPVAGGPNIQRALHYLPGLLSLYPRPDNPEILLSKVYLPHNTEAYDPFQDLKTQALALEEQISQPVVPIPVCAKSVTDALLSLAEARHCDAILLGASREGLLQTVLHGNIPALIASQTESTVLVFRESPSL
ncbi:chloride channel protein [Synechocystis sp. LKSZ1]|uniref:chloride channel protein n=1 Tax=Synechocystis sp. LKSZ1 TaxID=3144951 RepID=UPI00336BD0E0